MGIVTEGGFGGMLDYQLLFGKGPLTLPLEKVVEIKFKVVAVEVLHSNRA